MNNSNVQTSNFGIKAVPAFALSMKSAHTGWLILSKRTANKQGTTNMFSYLCNSLKRAWIEK